MTSEDLLLVTFRFRAVKIKVCEVPLLGSQFTTLTCGFRPLPHYKMGICLLSALCQACYEGIQQIHLLETNI